MKLRKKMLLIITFVWVVIILSIFFGSQFIIKKSYVALEDRETNNNIQRIQQAVYQNEKALQDTLGSWAFWDDTYNFMINKNAKYIQTNLLASSFTPGNIDMILFFDVNGKLFFSTVADSTHTKNIAVPTGLMKYLSANGPIVHQPDVNSGMTGLVSIPSGILIITAHAIATSKDTGPVHGTMIMARYLTSQTIEKLKNTTKLDFSIYSINRLGNTDNIFNVYNEMRASGSEYLIKKPNNRNLTAYALLKDINNKPVAIIEMVGKRSIWQLGLRTVYFYDMVSLISTATLIFLLWLLLNSLVIKRIERLNSSLSGKRRAEKLLAEFSSGLPDELSSVAQLYHHATHDPLTGLGNRHLIYQTFQNYYNRIKNDNKIVIIFIDLDKFKTINDTLGHEIGDKLLISVSSLLSSRLKSHDIAVRLGGDEFVVLLYDIAPDQVNTLVKRIFDTLKKELVIDGNLINLTCSMGISIYPDNGSDLTVLLRDADVALYQAKSDGRNRYVYYSGALEKSIRDANKLEMELQKSIENNELCLYYQPVFDVRQNQIINVEALIRWRHPERGLLTATHIIPAAEKSGLIIPIGIWALKTACRQMKAWHAMGLPNVPVAVNLSLLQLRDSNIGTLIREILKDNDLNPEFLELELTETNYVEMNREIINSLVTLKNDGIKFAVDDFGMGYSGLGYLRSLPVSKLKIDQSFVHDIEKDDSDRSIILAIIGIAHRLHLQVVAEGVETQAQYDFLKKNNVDGVQGNYLSPPLDNNSYVEFVKLQQKKEPATSG